MYMLDHNDYNVGYKQHFLSGYVPVTCDSKK